MTTEYENPLSQTSLETRSQSKRIHCSSIWHSSFIISNPSVDWTTVVSIVLYDVHGRTLLYKTYSHCTQRAPCLWCPSHTWSSVVLVCLGQHQCSVSVAGIASQLPKPSERLWSWGFISLLMKSFVDLKVGCLKEEKIYTTALYLTKHRIVKVKKDLPCQTHTYNRVVISAYWYFSWTVHFILSTYKWVHKCLITNESINEPAWPHLITPFLFFLSL